MTAVAPPVPVTGPTGARSRSGRRAIVRWALRLFRREWRQQLLVLAMLTLAVGAAVLGSTAAINAASDSSGRYGSGGALIRLDAADATSAQARLAEARAEFGTIDVTAHGTAAVPGSIVRLDVRDQDPSGPYSGPMLDVRDGRYPAPGEVALTPAVAGLFGARVGDIVDIGAAAMPVVGIVENPADLGDEFALVAPGTVARPNSYTVLVDPDTRNEQAAGRQGFGIESTGSEKEAVAAGVIAMSTLAMSLVALIAAAAFVVVAQRRQRQLGLLTAIGATARQVRMVTIANGAIVGVVAALVGGALGVAAWPLVAPAVERAANHRIGRFDLPWTVVVTLLLVAVTMATLAAWWPARATSRVPVMTALAGRPAQPRPVHRSLLVAVGLLALGLGAVAYADADSQDAKPLPLMIGLVAVIVGVVFVAPGAVRAAGSVARRLPFGPRLALRDLARYQSRAAAALAAIAFGLGVAVTIVALAAANQYRSDEGNLSSRQLLIRMGDPRTSPDPTASDTDLARLDEGAASVAATLGDDATAVPLDVAFNPDTAGDLGVREPVVLGERAGPQMLEHVNYPYVASAAVLDLYGIDATAIDPTIDLITSRDEPLILADVSARGRLDVETPTAHADLPTYDEAPNSLITESALQRHGWVAVRSAWIVELAEPLSAAQIADARAAAATAGLVIETRDGQDTLRTLRTGATLAGLVLAIAIVAMAVGLIRGEAARDIRTLTATGASARTRRSITASTAAALAMLGVVIGIGAAYAVLAVVYRSDLAELAPLPIGNLLMLAIGLPACAAAAGWLLAGKEPVSFSRQSLD